MAEACRLIYSAAVTDNPVLFDSMSRDELIAKAKSLGVECPQVMTRVELRDEILRRTELDERRLRQARGWFGVARDLVASVVERGLHLPDAASALRAAKLRAPSWAPPVATVTLAEIYASQGHRNRAIVMLDEVLQREPDHEMASLLRQRLLAMTPPAPRPSEALPTEQDDSTSGSPQVVVAAPTGESVEQRLEDPPALGTESGTPSEPGDDREASPRAEEEHIPSVDSVLPTLDVLLWRREPDGRFAAYWELGAATERHHVRRAPAGTLVCRVRGAYVERATCHRIEREVELRGSSGTVRLDGLPLHAQLRVALGWRTSDGFVPITLGLATDDRAHQWWEGLVAAPGREDELRQARARADHELARSPRPDPS